MQILLPPGDVVKDPAEKLSDDDYMFRHAAELRNNSRCSASFQFEARWHKTVTQLWSPPNLVKLEFGLFLFDTFHSSQVDPHHFLFWIDKFYILTTS